MATKRQRKNLLDSVNVNGVIQDEPGMIKRAVVRHFKLLFNEEWKNRPKLSGFFASINSTDSAELLEAEFLEDEIWEAIKGCDGNKAPGPDGFNLQCIQKCWNIMKGEFVQLMKEFHANGKLAKGINSSFITLIPKKENPVGLGDYRPISLISSIYKIVAKILSKRLRRVMPKIISEVQTAFLRGRHIIDGVLIANEVVDLWKRSKKKGLILKLDFEKAYDSVNWEFLYSMMKNFGFGEKWVGWIKTCISTARISVLVNGSPTSEFSPMKGLRQGDPLSPFLFNIVAEGLNILLERAKEVGLIRGVSAGPTELKITHLQFADDTIIFCEAEWEEVVAVKRILRCFEVMSGLKINFHKSKVCGVGVQDDIVQVFAKKLNCLSQKLPMSYLGLPLGTNPRRKAAWKPVIDKFKSKLASWKRRYLSFAGRLTLIKSVLSSLPVYFLSIFKLPVGIAKVLHKIQANFLWGGSETRRKLHLISWKEICVNKNKGGLGVRNLGQVNECLLVKWWWRYGNEEAALWKKVICSKYGGVGGRWCPLFISSVGLSYTWRGITSVAEGNIALREFFWQNFRLVVGNGRRIHFWFDKWCHNQNLSVSFPRLFALSVEKDGKLVDFVHRRVSDSDWNLVFRRPLLAWEEEEVQKLNDFLQNAPRINEEMVDSCSWVAHPSEEFTVASVWKWMEASQGVDIAVTRCIWINLAPPKAQFLSWLAWRGRVKCYELLQKVGVLSPNASSLCVFCKSEVETVNHVFIHCHFTWKLWANLVNWWNYKWVSPGSVEGLLLSWPEIKMKKKMLTVWKTLPVAVMWSVWRSRNDCVFNKLHFDMDMEPENDCAWKPKHGMTFDSEQSVYDFHNTYGGRIEFSIRRDFCRKNKFTNQLICRFLVCNKEGFRKVDKRDPLAKNTRAETRTGCEARLYVKLDEGTGRFVVTDFKEKHNHDLVSPECAHMLPSQRKISTTQAIELDLAAQSDLRLGQSIELMGKEAGGRQCLGFTKLDQKNYLRTKRQQSLAYGEVGNVLQYFKEKSL
ncbi:uncharacterized protein LOC114281693 [Camellia sinensis]|uniref:uncharacterized protein LOC114281693 n=1 Tax=Camellia sinensis TaxID=4442 RepID=UPI001036D68A|nr:uncharacterized protein LOC114281693 [Camellia sinensis]